MNKRFYLFLILFSLCGGILLFAIMQEWIIIRTSLEKYNHAIDQSSSKKTISLYYFNDNGWQQEQINTIWHDKLDENILNITNCWLTMLHEEKISSKKIAVTNVLIDNQSTAYVSFDRPLFNKSQTILEKWKFIEGLFKTLFENGIKIVAIRFLINHQPMQDSHLDFSQAWPLHGFAN